MSDSDARMRGPDREFHRIFVDVPDEYHRQIAAQRGTREERNALYSKVYPELLAVMQQHKVSHYDAMNILTSMLITTLAALPQPVARPSLTALVAAIMDALGYDPGRKPLPYE